jgi:UDP-N-acetyl-alpha-D-muramoyl-L-alanyl-L-glutamate epimerase
MIDASDAAEQIESADPTEPIDNTEPREPIDSRELSDQSDHFEVSDRGFARTLLVSICASIAPAHATRTAQAAARRACLYADAMVVGTPRQLFDPTAFQVFRFLARDLDERGRVTLRYALDEDIEFVETFDLPVQRPLRPTDREAVDGLLSLLHWVAGVSYFKTAAPPAVRCEAGAPPPGVASLLEALYSEGLGEFAYVNSLARLPRPVFPAEQPVRLDDALNGPAIARVLIPVGGGKDSAVAIETMRRSQCELALFSVGDAPAISRTAAAAELSRLVAHRQLDPRLGELNRTGALNGHVPVTAIVACAALLTAALNGFDAIAMANERSASSGNLVWDGVEINHQFSKSLAVERLLRSAIAELAPGLELFSILRPASELAIARAFARMDRYHEAFTSCNAIFRLDPALRAESWCCDCPKCRFVFLVLAPFSEPAHLREIFGRDLLDEEHQFDGFALLTATGGDKPFECVGEEQESLAAIRMLADDPRWRDHRVVRRLVVEVLPRHAPEAGSPATALTLSDDHAVPESLMPGVRAILGA